MFTHAAFLSSSLHILRDAGRAGRRAVVGAEQQAGCHVTSRLNLIECFLLSVAPMCRLNVQECVSALQPTQTKFGLYSPRAVLLLSVCLWLHADRQLDHQLENQSLSRDPKQEATLITGILLSTVL